jgi:hypothetical protein
MEDEKGESYDDDDGPEVDKLCAQNSGVAVCQDGEVVSFDVEEGQDNICNNLAWYSGETSNATLTLPPVLQDNLSPLLESIPVQCVAGIHEIQQYIVEQCLKRWD